jgi:hypothetical protein
MLLAGCGAARGPVGVASHDPALTTTLTQWNTSLIAIFDTAHIDSMVADANKAYFAETACGDPGDREGAVVDAIGISVVTGDPILQPVDVNQCIIHGSLAEDDVSVYVLRSAFDGPQSATADLLRVFKTDADPVVLVAGIPQPTSLGIATDGQFVYFGNTGTVSKVPVTGGTPTVLAQGLRLVLFVRVDQDSVYFIDEDPTGATPANINKVSKAGGAVTVLASDPQKPQNLLVTDSVAVWATAVFANTPQGFQDVGTLKQVAKSGGDVAVLADGIGDVVQVLSDANNFYVAESLITARELGFVGRLLRVPLAGGSPTVLYEGVQAGDAQTFDQTADTLLSLGNTKDGPGFFSVPKQ